MRRDLAVCLLLLVCTAAVYGQTIGHEFIQYDDHEYVYENTHVRRGLTWEGAGWAFTTLWAGNWHPLTWLSHMLDCELFGLRPGYHHLVNVLLHILNSMLLYLVLRRMTGAVWRSAAVAALFALHPLHVESVAWVSERKDVLSTLFFMLTLWAYAFYVARPSPVRIGPVVVALGLGLLAKPMLVTAPFVLLLLDFWPLGRFRPKEGEGLSLKRLLVEKIPLFALVAASSLATLVAQQRGGATAAIDAVPLGHRAANAAASYGTYVGKMLWPRNLAFFYPYRDSVSTAEWLVPALLLVGVTALVIGLSWRYRYMPVGWFWYLGTLIPVIGLVQVGKQSMADRYTYVPLIGLFLMGVWGLADLASNSRRGRVLLTSGIGGVLIACMVGTWFRVGLWRDGVTLFGQALEVTEGNALAHSNLGLALAERGRTEEAIHHYRAALRIDPTLDTAHGNLGNALIEQGEREEGIRHLEQALGAKSASAKAHNNLGNEFMLQGETEKAIEHYEEALRIHPEQAATHSNLGNALMSAGRPEEGMAHYREAIRIDPEFAQPHNNLGLALAQQGNRDEAIVHLREALRLDPSYADGHFNLGALLAQLDRVEEATGHYREAIRIDPAYARAHYELGGLSAGKGEPGEAISHFRNALAGNSEYFEAHGRLAVVLADQGKHKEAAFHYSEAIRLRPGDPGAYNNLAWIRATHPDPDLRNGAEAVRLAEKACSLWGQKEPNLLDTLAAAYAEAGRFSEAVATLEQALVLAPSATPDRRASQLEARLQGYRAGRPHRESREQGPGQ